MYASRSKALIRSAALVLALLWGQISVAASLDIPPLATEEQVAEAMAAFAAWTKHYQQGEYDEQYRLTHQQIRHFKSQKGWIKKMRRSAQVNGELTGIEILAAGPIAAEKIPCTELGHCYRKDVQTVMIVVNSHYAKAGIKEKEYIVMANSDEGWTYGGGSFLNRPFGETMAILDRKDVRQNEYKRSR